MYIKEGDKKEVMLKKYYIIDFNKAKQQSYSLKQLNKLKKMTNNTKY